MEKEFKESEKPLYGILHDESQLSKICLDVEESFKMGGLANTIYSDYAISVAKKYSDELFSKNFPQYKLSLILSGMCSDTEIIGLIILSDQLESMANVGMGSLNELMSCFTSIIKSRLSEFDENRIDALKINISSLINSNAERIDETKDAFCQQVDEIKNRY